MEVGGIAEIQLISFLASALDVGELHVPERESQFPLNTPLSLTNKMQHYKIFFIVVNALHVSGGFSAHSQEL